MLYHHTFSWGDTRDCVMQFWPPDDEQMCSKHVEAWNKLIVRQKFCAPSWLINEINIIPCLPFLPWLASPAPERSLAVSERRSLYSFRLLYWCSSRKHYSWTLSSLGYCPGRPSWLSHPEKKNKNSAIVQKCGRHSGRQAMYVWSNIEALSFNHY